MKFFKVITLILFFATPAFADLNEGLGDASSFQQETTVIDPSFISMDGWMEPIFSKSGQTRDIASLNEVSEADVGQPIQGQLEMQKEIPYSYPWMSRHTLELRVLNEIEAEESKNQ